MDAWSRKQALGDLRYHWGDAYGISYDSRWWRATRIDARTILLAPGPQELRDLIVSDYSRKPVLH